MAAKPSYISSTQGWTRTSLATQNKMLAIAEFVKTQGWEVKTIYAYVPGTNSHVDGRTLDIMIPDGALQKDRGTAVKNFIWERKSAWDVHYVVWRDMIYSTTKGAGGDAGLVYQANKPKAQRDTSHFWHIHVTFRTDKMEAFGGSSPVEPPPVVTPPAQPLLDFVMPSRTAFVMPPKVKNKNYVMFKGKKFNEKMVTYLNLLEQMFGKQLKVMQGSYNSGVAQSGGTHDGADAVDLSVSGYTSEEKTKLLVCARLLGGAAWRRTPDQGDWGEHVHIIRVNGSGASSGAKNQVAAYKAGKIGLANGKKDDGPQVGVFDMDTTRWAKMSITYLSVKDANTARKWRFISLDIMLIQTLLDAVSADDIVTDGDFGPKSQAAFDTFRRSLGWPESDCIGEIGLTSSKRLIETAQKKFEDKLPEVVG